jgi:DNA-binding YbaB/EbfC family protein
MPMPPNINKMLEEATKLQEEMAAAQEKLKEERVDASAGGGMVKVVATGDGRLESIAIDPDAVDPEDVELLQDMVLAAVNEALRQAEQLRDKAMEGAAGFDPMEALGSLGLGGLGGGMGGLPGGLPGGAPPNRAARRKKR